MSGSELLGLFVAFLVVLVVGTAVGWAMRRPVSVRWGRPRVWLARLLLIGIFALAAWLFVTSSTDLLG
jgi:hypothetical protein